MSILSFVEVCICLSVTFPLQRLHNLPFYVKIYFQDPNANSKTQVKRKRDSKAPGKTRAQNQRPRQDTGKAQEQNQRPRCETVGSCWWDGPQRRPG